MPFPTHVCTGGTRDLVFYMERNGGIRGRVVDASGSPVDSFSVRYGEVTGNQIIGFGKRKSFSDSGGFFEIYDLDPDEYLLEAWADGYAFARSQPIPVKKGQWVEGITLYLGEGSTLEGVLVEELSGSPVRGAEVLVRPADKMAAIFRQDFAPYLIRRGAPSSSDGGFSVDHVGPGDYWLQVNHPDFAEKIVRGIQVASEGTTLDLGKIALLRGGILEGTVRSADGEPVHRAQMLITREGYRNRVKTDPNGYYRFEKVPAGTYTITVERVIGRRRDGLSFPQISVAVTEGSEQTVDF
jgi:hypothetical protein